MTPSQPNTETAVIDELEFRSYAHNRMMFPDVAPERWALIFRNVPEMEERFCRTFILKMMEAAEELGVIGECGHA